jgi:hypothetical protein
MNGTWEGIIKVLVSKVFIIFVVFGVMLFVTLFPHTKTTKVHSDLTGVSVIQKEQYFFHTRVGFETIYLCMSDVGTKSQSIAYRLNGDIKSKEISYCDGTNESTRYNFNGTKRSYELVSFVAGNIQMYSEQYNTFGLLTTQINELDGVTSTTSITYNDSNIKTEMTVTRESLEVKTYEKVTTYDDGVISENTIGNWENGVATIFIKNVYTDGALTGVSYFDEVKNLNARVTCDQTRCILVKLTADKFTVLYNDEEFNYDLFVEGEIGAVKVNFTPILTTNIPEVLTEIEGIVQVILNAQ